MTDKETVPRNEAIEQLRRIAAVLERIERNQDELAATLLDGLLPHGKPIDRWARRRGAA